MPKTGATRYQKFLKSEKSKTKLKGKKDKELPRGTNVTKTNFKVKKIVLKEQLKKHNHNEALSSRKLNAKELLSRLGHFNVNSRTDALDGLTELITAHPEVLEENLGQLISNVTPLLLNIEKMVRQECLKVLHLMLSNISPEKIRPFYDILSTYLRSAMTHIDNRIQDDSLLFLDVLLVCTSQMISTDFHKIIPNFLDMISKLKIDSKPGRTLTINLDNKVTSVKWRVKVLHRLQDFLQKFIEHHNIKKVNKSVTDKTEIFDETKNCYYPLQNPVYTSVCHLSCFSSKNLQEVETFDEVQKFQSYIETLMPLLFETWLEVCPAANSNKHIETVISEDSAILLRHILKVISLLFDLVKFLDKKNPNAKAFRSFCNKYQQSFSQHFINSFPFVTSVRSKQRNKDVDPKLVYENLEICYLFVALGSFTNLSKLKIEVSLIVEYIEDIFVRNTEVDIGNSILNIMDTVFSDEISNMTKITSVKESLFEKLISAYFNKDMSILSERLFELLCKIALNDKLSQFHETDAFKHWLNSLPDILLRDTITVHTIDILHKFATRNNKIFNAIIKNKLLKILENLPKITVTECSIDSRGYHKLFSLLYWIKSWDNDSLNMLEKQLLNNSYKTDHGKYIFETLKLRSCE